MRVDVRYALNVQAGDLIAGVVAPSAPTRPVQPFAAALRVESVRKVLNNSGRTTEVVLGYGGAMSSAPYSVADQVLVIVE